MAASALPRAFSRRLSSRFEVSVAATLLCRTFPEATGAPSDTSGRKPSARPRRLRVKTAPVHRAPHRAREGPIVGGGMSALTWRWSGATAICLTSIPCRSAASMMAPCAMFINPLLGSGGPHRSYRPGGIPVNTAGLKYNPWTHSLPHFKFLRKLF
jgi:hypothetical protein